MQTPDGLLLEDTPMTRHSSELSIVCTAIGLGICCLATNAHAVSSAEFYSSRSYVYGRFEARIQFAAGDGVISSFFLWKDGSEKSGTFWNELDFEKLGADCHLETNAYYGNPAATHSQKHALTQDLCGGYHEYTYEWTPEYIAWLVDGVEIRRETGAAATAYADNATTGMQIRFNIWPGNASFGGNFSDSILPVYQYVDWVQYSSYADGAFKLEWREDFAGSTLPQGWLTGNWKSPKNLSTHTPKNIGVANDNLVLALTADDATGITSNPPSGGGGTSATGTAATGTGGATSTPITANGTNPTGTTVGGASSNPVTGGGSTALGSAATTTPAADHDSDSGCSVSSGNTPRRTGLLAFLAIGAAAFLSRRNRSVAR
jgi:MYXO-CTERM domain-containing protein